MRIATGCTRYTNTQHLRDETKPFEWTPISNFHATQLKQLTQTQTYSLHDLNAYSDPSRNTKTTIFHNNDHNNIIILEPNITFEECRGNLKHTHITTSSQYLSSRKNSKVTSTTPNDVHSSKQTLPRHMRTKLAKLRGNKSPLLQSSLHTVNPNTYMPQCPLCFSHTHDTNYLFNCSQVPTQRNTTSL